MSKKRSREKFLELKNDPDKRMNIGVFLLFLVVLSCVYFPVFSSHYVYHDDYYYWAYQKGLNLNHPQFKFTLQIGRPVGGIIVTGVGLLVNTIKDANIVRFFLVVILSITAYLVYAWMIKSSFKPLHSLLLTLAIFTLPAFQVMVTCLVASSLLIAVLTAAIAALFAFKAVSAKSIRGIITGKYTILAVVFLIVSLATYQTSAMFYWVFIAIMILSLNAGSWRKHLRSIISLFVINFVAVAIYFAISSLWAISLQDTSIAATASTYQFALATDVLNKISWFFNAPMVDAVNLWNIFPVKAVLYCFIFIFIAGMACEIINSLKNLRLAPAEGKPETITPKGILSNCLQKFGFLIILFPLSYLPNLVAKGATFSPYRALLALSPFIILVLYWALSQILHFIWSTKKEFIISLVVGITALTGLFSAKYTSLNHLVVPYTSELKYVEHALKSADLTQYKEIHLIYPIVSNRRQEFGNLSTAFWQDIPWIIKCALREIGKENQWEQFKGSISSGKWDEPIPSDNQTLIIDMTNLPNTQLK